MPAHHSTLTQYADGTFVPIAHPNRLVADTYRRQLWRSPFTPVPARTCEVVETQIWPQPATDPCGGELPDCALDLIDDDPARPAFEQAIKRPE